MIADLCNSLSHLNEIKSDNITTFFYLTCNSVTVKIAVFYKSNNYLWIGKENSTTKTWFGDTERIISK